MLADLPLPARKKANKPSGFSIIELMVALAIAGAIAVVAIPSFIEQVRKSRRADATTALLDVASRQERFFSDNNRYAASLAVNPPAGLGVAAITDNGYYELALTSSAPTTFTITASPTGGQTNDTECPGFTMNHLGVKGVPGFAAGNERINICW